MFGGQRPDQAGLVGEVPARGAERLYGVGHQRSDRIERGHLASGVGAHLAVGRLGPGTEFAPVSEDPDGAPGKAAQYIKSRPQ